ncbi:MAG TPA: type VII secretion target [Actinophytocola sp.]|uniref:type VII secretion target n=1 Tax=Actinophytocola sp. TaxID=1872138 RepID=UPI002DBF6083|nr:type VII secretion target [Actinophytocola sp.]HEU5472182.1 type VII secretion target [Actinophytocola sp.]
MDGYEVLTGELDAHAGRVDGLTDRLRTAADAANQVTMNNDAYGVVCQPFAQLLQPFEELGVRALRQGVDALADTARKVRDTAKGYTTTDTSEAAQYQGMEGDL